MIQSEIEITKFEPKSFKFMKRFNTSVNVNLFSKTIISVMDDKHHGYPVISGVTRNLFRATVIFIYQNFSLSCRTIYRTDLWSAACDKKSMALWEKKKRDVTFHPRVFTGVQITWNSQPQLITRKKLLMIAVRSVLISMEN